MLKTKAKRKMSACNGMNFIWIMHNERDADQVVAPAQIPLREQKTSYTLLLLKW